jgi:hypothetical protein
MAVSQMQGVHCWCKEAHSAGIILLTLRFLLETAKFAMLKPTNQDSPGCDHVLVDLNTLEASCMRQAGEISKEMSRT